MVERRAARAAESLLENERLTADLDDAAAQVLLDWGIALAKTIAQSTASMDDAAAEEAMYPRMRALRQLLRAVNRGAVSDVQSQVEWAAQIVEQAALVYGTGFVSPDKQPAPEPGSGNPLQMIQAVRDWLKI